MKYIYLLIMACFLVFPFTANAGNHEAYFVLQGQGQFPPNPKEPNKTWNFVIKSTNWAFIKEARKRVYGTYDGGENNVAGYVQMGREDWNRGYDFHLDEKKLTFFENAIELCDGTPWYINNDIQGWLDSVPKGIWCPWSSKVVKEVNLECPAVVYSDTKCRNYMKRAGYPHRFPCVAQQCSKRKLIKLPGIVKENHSKPRSRAR